MHCSYHGACRQPGATGVGTIAKLLKDHQFELKSVGNSPKLGLALSSAFRTSGGGLHERGKGSVRAAIASERYLSDVEVKLHNMHMHDQVFITNNDEHVEEIAMKQ